MNILNESILISKVCTIDNIQTWSNIHVHMDIMECKVSHTPCTLRVYHTVILSTHIDAQMTRSLITFAIHNNCLWKYPFIIKVIWVYWMCLFWHLQYVLLTLYIHGAMSMSIWILWNVKCLHVTTCRYILCILIHICIHMDIM